MGSAMHTGLYSAVVIWCYEHVPAGVCAGLNTCSPHLMLLPSMLLCLDPSRWPEGGLPPALLQPKPVHAPRPQFMLHI